MAVTANVHKMAIGSLIIYIINPHLQISIYTRWPCFYAKHVRVYVSVNTRKHVFSGLAPLKIVIDR